MKKQFYLFLLFSLPCILNAQKYQFWVEFQDKKETGFSINHPEIFLSERAIERRIKQNIPIDSTDLPVKATYLQEVQATGAAILHKSRWMNACIIGTNDSSIVTQIRQKSFVKKVELTKITDSTAKLSIRKLTTEITSQTTDSAIAQKRIHNLDLLHQEGFKGKGIHIAIIDAGFLLADKLASFDSLLLQKRVLGTYDFINPLSDIYKEHLHGMAVFSILAANVPGKMIGSAPDASYWLFRTEDAPAEYPAECDYWICAAEFADSVGVDIINSSLVYTEFDNEYKSYTYQEMNGKATRISKAATMAARKGILVVNSAGNLGNKTWHYVGAPADADSILTVGGVNASGIHSIFSSYGPTFDNRIKPTVCSVASSSVYIGENGFITDTNGTSFSAPVISGLAACLWQAFPSLKNTDIINLIVRNSSQYLHPDNTLGYGIPNAIQAYWAQKGKPADNAKHESLIYPNPFDEYLVIQNNDNHKVKVLIRNLTGVILNSFEVEKKLVLNTTEWKQGMYILSVFNKETAYQSKIVKYRP